jgi:hypothetical protein
MYLHVSQSLSGTYVLVCLEYLTYIHMQVPMHWFKEFICACICMYFVLNYSSICNDLRSSYLQVYCALGLVGKAKAVQSFDLDGVGSISAIPPRQITCFVEHFNKLE